MMRASIHPLWSAPWVEEQLAKMTVYVGKVVDPDVPRQVWVRCPSPCGRWMPKWLPIQAKRDVKQPAPRIEFCQACDDKGRTLKQPLMPLSRWEKRVYREAQ